MGAEGLSLRAIHARISRRTAAAVNLHSPPDGPVTLVHQWNQKGSGPDSTELRAGGVVQSGDAPPYVSPKPALNYAAQEGQRGRTVRFFHDDADRTPRAGLGSSLGHCKTCAAVGLTAALFVLGILVFLFM